jgi:hypothetical protein
MKRVLLPPFPSGELSDAFERGELHFSHYAPNLRAFRKPREKKRDIRARPRAVQAFWKRLEAMSSQHETDVALEHAQSVESVQAQPVEAQSVEAQSVQAQPVQAQPVQAQPVQAQSVQAQLVHAEQEGEVFILCPLCNERFASSMAESHFDMHLQSDASTDFDQVEQ